MVQLCGKNMHKLRVASHDNTFRFRCNSRGYASISHATVGIDIVNVLLRKSMYSCTLVHLLVRM